MAESTIHEGNDTPTASDEGKRVDADTPQPQEGAAVSGQGVGVNPTDPSDPDQFSDPKSGGSPVHPSPGADSQQGASNAEGAAEGDAEAEGEAS
jgi:hypothetical protein